MPAQSFRALIRKDRSNPYVDVPARVSAAFADRARQGRIHVAGMLDRTPIRATLNPVGGGRHRLYVNGGMRAAAGVGVGDTVHFSLRASRPGEVPLPAGLSTELRKTAGARAAFDALSPSHRRELVRYVDDARTPEARRKRIASAIQHALGKTPPRGGHASEKPLWTCPKCGNQFVSRNIYHSCERHSLDDCFRGKPPEIRRLFDRFREIVEACGPVRAVPYRDRVGFMAQVRFAGGIPRRKWLDVHFWLTRRLESPRFSKVETLGPSVHIYTVRVTQPEDLDRELSAWIREAYKVGRRKHLAVRDGPGPRDKIDR